MTVENAAPDFENDAWDDQMAADHDAGRLDALFATAGAEYVAGLVLSVPGITPSPQMLLIFQQNFGVGLQPYFFSIR